MSVHNVFNGNSVDTQYQFEVGTHPQNISSTKTMSRKSKSGIRFSKNDPPIVFAGFFFPVLHPIPQTDHAVIFSNAVPENLGNVFSKRPCIYSRRGRRGNHTDAFENSGNPDF